jgi:hypothetical protein
MGRVREYVKVKGKKFWTLFDTGARRTYGVPNVASRLATTKLSKPVRPRLGGKIQQTSYTGSG